MDPRQLFNTTASEYRKWGWKKNPFTIQPSPDFLVDCEAEAKELLISIRNGAHSLLLGDLGTGKTTLLLWLRRALRDRAYVVYFEEPRDNFLRGIEEQLRTLGAFGLLDSLFPVKLTAEKLPRVRKPVVILVDEAHRMSKEQAEEVNLLADKENLTVVMAGHLDLKKKLEHARPLLDRLITTVSLKPLPAELLSELIKMRIRSAGGRDLGPFSDVVVKEIGGRAEGNPREALRLCNIVLTAVLAGEKLE